MIIISDTSPISNLIIIGRLDLLKQLYGQVLIPQIVYNEIMALRQFSYDLSDFVSAEWIDVVDPVDDDLIQILRGDLDFGEASAIALAIETPSSCLLIDEKKGRAIAESHGLEIIGLVGILLEAKAKKIITSVRPFIDQLIEEAGFRISNSFYSWILIRTKEEE